MLKYILSNKTGRVIRFEIHFWICTLISPPGPMSSEFVLQTKHGGKDSKSGVITHLSVEKFEVSAYGHSVDNV